MSARRPVPVSRQRQEGVVLLVALIMLVAMTIAGLSMLRSLGAGSAIAGNLGFKQNATSVADLSVEAARAWMIAQTQETLATSIVSAGYYSDWREDFNPLTHDWTNSTLVTNDEGTGNEVRYVVHRLCKTAGLQVNAPLQQCATVSPAGELESKAGSSYGHTPGSASVQPYFRVTARVRGPRSTVSYTQVLMY